ncbi:MAG TPA: bifunctional (p)ppGpp synthetase/guanosine-3',5'-bis(diphosphate) 3'-pyrophosphohydrolase [Nitrospirales bacterium]|jgi:GTP pyrophosphokinase|nr:bifunctional (p)ppGpp synthetase/guanosine-3',5'-bis(diphosphate) 3'-pyrophosphohydrolase [Nitrospirales bacterium]
MATTAATSVHDLIEQVQRYNPNAQVDLIRRAYDFSARAHEGQVRRSGEPYLKHPLAVAEVLAALKLDVPAIVAGLLHDTVEDTVCTQAQIEEEFGKNVARLVDGVTKIGQIHFKSYEEKQAENFRKMLISMADDVRVILIKLADRLHNMRTLEHLSPAHQQKVAQETLEIYAPLANRLGIGWMKAELEDLCFKALKPDVYAALAERVTQLVEEREQYIQEVIGVLRAKLAEHGLVGEMAGRSKHLYSVYQKMEKQKVSFEEVYDLTAIRVITDTQMNCYAIMGLIHSLWRPVPGRFKDYIGVPKSNHYQSLHTTVVGPKGEHVEFQIRTHEMHRIAKEGIAAHWTYKEQGEIDETEKRVFTWLRQLLESHQDLTDNRQFMESVKLDLYSDVVYVFTPKGAVKELVKGATPIDFAYAIHTEVGDHCSGAKVNGKMVPLKHQLRSGDTVEVITASTQVPHRDWLKFVKTPRAKNKIKHWLRVEEAKRSLEVGKRLLERELRRHDAALGPLLKTSRIQDVAKESGLPGVDELFTAIGYGRVSAIHVANRLCVEEGGRLVAAGAAAEVEEKAGAKRVPTADEKGVKVKGVHDLMMHLSKCCEPVPGDRIIGYITRGRGLTIHTADCPNLDALDYDKARLVDVDWDTTQATTVSVKISVLTLDKPGMLANVSAAITNAEANISRAEITTREDRKALLDFIVEVQNTAHVDRVVKAIEKIDGVLQARRVRSWQGTK